MVNAIETERYTPSLPLALALARYFAVDHSIWPPLGGGFGVTYLVGLFIAIRRG